MDYSPEFINLLSQKNIRESLSKKDFKSLYEQIDGSLISQFTQFCYNVLKIDPLGYLDYIPEGFLHASEIEEFTIPDGMKSIGDIAFYGCKSLKVIEIPSSVTSVGDSAFSFCSSLTSIEIPNGVTDIGYEAFYTCRNLTNVIIPNSVTNIESRVFVHCSSLRSIKYNGTKEQWGNISKGYDWNKWTPASKVICDDGVIVI